MKMTVTLHAACAGGACAGTIAVNLLTGIFPDHAPPAYADCLVTLHPGGHAACCSWCCGQKR